MVLVDILSSPFCWGSVVVLALGHFLYQLYIYKRSQSYQQLPVTKQPKDRKNGTWVPMDVSFPKPKPYPNWSITGTKPLPYRPFKHNYFVTMGIRSLDLESWIELDSDWPKYHDRKLARLEQPNAKDLYGVDPVAKEGLQETLEMLLEYLPARYPTLFRRTAVGIDNIHTGEHFDISKDEPVIIITKLLQDDFAIMIEGEDGQYYLKAGSILLAGFWRLKDKLHMPLYKIHTSGEVPHYEAKMQTPMDRFFKRLTPDKSVVRNNYFIQTDEDVAWSHAIGPENSDNIGWFTAENASDPEKLMFRSERQSVRRLPRSGAILFTIRTYFLPVAEIAEEPHVPRRLLNGIKAWDSSVAGYKGLEKYGDVLIPYLEQKAEEQEKNGYLPEKEVANYPY